MGKVGIFYGSSTGNSETVAHLIREHLEGMDAQVHDIAFTPAEELNNYDCLIFGISTWGIGDMQDDWVDFHKNINPLWIQNKKIALFGLGDQETYSDSFADAMGLLYHKINKVPVSLIGQWPTQGYQFDNSKAILNGKFIGLVIDEDVQSHLTESRIKEWVQQIKNHLE